jgi:hypothetical protein
MNVDDARQIYTTMESCGQTRTTLTHVHSCLSLTPLCLITVTTADQPDCLHGLTDIEEMLIARIKPVMHVRYTTGRQLSYKDHIINLPQDIADVAQRLPRIPQDLEIVIIRRQDDDLDRHLDYLCRRQVVHDALLYTMPCCTRSRTTQTMLTLSDQTTKHCSVFLYMAPLPT